MSSPPERIAQSDVHEDAIRAFKRLALTVRIALIVLVTAALVVAVWWRFG